MILQWGKGRLYGWRKELEMKEQKGMTGARRVKEFMGIL